MTGKERILTALNRGCPDTVPVWELAFNEKSIVDIARHFTDESRLPEPKFFGDMKEEELFQLVDAFNAMIRGLDLDGISAVSTIPYERVDERHVRDVRGVVYHCSNFGEPYPMSGPISCMDDLLAYKIPPPVEMDFLQVVLMRSQFPDKSVSLMMPGPFYLSWCLRGAMDKLLMDYALNKPLARALARMATDYCLEVVENAARKGVDFIILECDLAHNLNTLMSRGMYEEFIGPYHREIVTLAHERGLKVVKHSDGMLKPFIPLFIEEGFDAIHPIQPQCLDIGEIKREFGSKLCIIGNIDCAELLISGTPEEVRETVHRTIEMVAPGGGYIISSSNTIHPGCNPENYIALVHAAREFGKY